MRHSDTTVSDLMSTQVITIRPETTLAEAHEEMVASDIRHLPVLDGDGRLVGIISDRDLSRALALARNARHRVSELMVRDVLTVAPRTFAREAAQLMLTRKVGALPVLDDALALVGIITETDFVRVAYQALGGVAG
jgi:CBS domain-containing protein